MSWLIVAKMPLLMSSRMTSAGLTERRSARSLTVIVAGSSTAPRSRGSATWTAAPANAASRRGGLRGPRRPRVPLLLLANGSSSDRHLGVGRVGRRCELGGELRGQAHRDRGGEGSGESAAARGAGDAGLVATDVGPAAVGVA